VSRFTGLIALSALALTACTDPATEKRIAELEAKVEQLSKSGGAKGPSRAAANSPEEQEAAKLLREATQDVQKGDYDSAKKKIAEIQSKYGATRAAQSAQRMAPEINLVGSAAPDINVDKWFQGETNFDDGKATLVVFWEVWCPHCKREVPKLEATYQSWKGKGLNMVGLTKQTRDITDDQVSSFIQEKGISYPIGHEVGQSMSDAFAVRGVPAAAVVKDGKIIWRGHPARLNDEMIEGFVN